MKNENLIYSLSCPITNEVHYIGKSTQGMIRPMQHLTKSHSEKIRQWVSDLKELNYKPKINVLEYVSSFEDINGRERYWIQYELNKGSLLLNENLVTPLIIDPNLDKVLDGTKDLTEENSIESLKISRLIKERRKMVNLTQKQFAGKCGIALTVLRKIEQNETNFSFDALLIVLKMLGCTLEAVKINK